MRAAPTAFPWRTPTLRRAEVASSQAGACLTAAVSQSGVKLCCSGTVLPEVAPVPPPLSEGSESLCCCRASLGHILVGHIYSLISSADLGPSGCFCAHVFRVRFPLCSPALIESLIASTLRGLQCSCHARSDELAAR